MLEAHKFESYEFTALIPRVVWMMILL